MKSSLLKRFVAMILCLCLVPCFALGEASPESEPEFSAITTIAPKSSEETALVEEEYDEEMSDEDYEEYAEEYDEDDEEYEEGEAEEEPAAPKRVFHSAFDLRLSLHPDGFSKKSPSLGDWQAFLNRLSLRGYANTMDYLHPESRVYINAGLYVDGKNRVPFVYDGYHSYRYLISPVFRDVPQHFQMHNFLEFMLKPYHYMELPTQYLGLLMYPEASYYIGDSYYTPTAKALAGEGTHTISYDDLYSLAEELNLIVMDDIHYERAYFYFTALLLDIGASDVLLEKLGSIEALLDHLDPEAEGMTITTAGNQTTYVLGETTVFQKKQVGDAISWVVTIPDPDGYLTTLTYQWTPSVEGAALNAQLTLSQGEDEKIRVNVDGTGLPCEGDMGGKGRVTLGAKGSLLSGILAQTFDFEWSIDKPELPFRFSLTVDALHNTTQKPVLSLHYDADMKEVKESVFTEGAYSQNDFFNLNDSFGEEYREHFLGMGLAFLPVILAMPRGVLNDIVRFAQSTGILSSLGL